MTENLLRSYAKRIPFLVSIVQASRQRRKMKRRSKQPPYPFTRKQWQDHSKPDEMRRQQALNLLDYTKTSGTAYAARKCPAGYHEITIHGETFAGQRSPQERLQHIPIDFHGKSLLDIGCNQGGMIFALQEQVKWAVGVDYDYKMINACNFINNAFGTPESRFYVFDIDKDPHDLLLDFLPENRVDIVFLLAVCMWVKNWRDLIRFCARISDQMVFETNGTDKQQRDQIKFLNETYSSVKLLSSSSSDDDARNKRQLLIASNN